MNLIKDDLDLLNEKLKSCFVEPVLDDKIENFVLGPSKRIRSVLAILYFRALDCSVSEKFLEILSATELIHNASLLHDDVIDSAVKRRGEDTILKQFSPKISILAGDFLLSLAVERLQIIDDNKILNIFKNCVKNMTLAEINQYVLRNQKPKIEDYLEICKGKTANLFSATMEACAVYFNLNPQDAKRFAEIYGVVFQIKNDLEIESAKIDKKNGIYTAKDILGIEKTAFLLDNYKEDMRELLAKLPNNIYKTRLEDLVTEL